MMAEMQEKFNAADSDNDGCLNLEEYTAWALERNEDARAKELFVDERPESITRAYHIFNDIKPDDIKQGSCGDCYFLSCLSSLAENPERVKRIFVTQEPNQSGCYCVKVWVDGEP